VGDAELLGVGACEVVKLGVLVPLALGVAVALAVSVSLAVSDGVAVDEGVVDGEQTFLCARRRMPRSGAAAPAPIDIHVRPALALDHVEMTDARPVETEGHSPAPPPRHATGTDVERTSA